MKRCPRCEITKEPPEFNKNKKNSDGLHGWCKECRKSFETRNRSTRAYTLLYHYGITEEDYLNLLKSQNYRCKICREECITFKNLSVDHDHSCCPGKRSCGKCIRGLLCSRCNQALGLFRNNIEFLRAAVDYLM